ncbi:MAG: hypothetical protein ABGY96_01240 [bacterium]
MNYLTMRTWRNSLLAKQKKTEPNTSKQAKTKSKTDKPGKPQTAHPARILGCFTY